MYMHCVAVSAFFYVKSSWSPFFVNVSVTEVSTIIDEQVTLNINCSVASKENFNN